MTNIVHKHKYNPKILQRDKRSVFKRVIERLCRLFWKSELNMTLTYDEYVDKRKKLLDTTLEYRGDYQIRKDFTQEEISLNNWIKEEKKREITIIESANNGLHPAQLKINHLRDTYLPQSMLWDMVASMPKGAMLHVHFDAIVDIKWMINEAVTSANCYFIRNKDVPYLSFEFFNDPPSDTKWLNVHQEWLKDKEGLEKEFEESMTITHLIGDLDKTSDAKIWHHFEGAFMTIANLINYEPVFRRYTMKKLQDMHNDGVCYFEERLVRSEVKLYDGNGKTYPPDYTFKVMKECLDEYMKHKSNNLCSFFGVKVIVSGLKFVDPSVVREDMEATLRLKHLYPDLIAGFDLVGYEDKGHPYSYYAKEFIWFQEEQKRLNLSVPFLSHAGETVDCGSQADANLFDSIVFGAKRIGHGLAVLKHPSLMQVIKKNDIAVELCPISNKVLKYTPSDLRLHPVISFMNAGVPVVLSPDDPAIFGIEKNPCSYDFWMVLVIWSSFDLASLKCLILNSIKYSVVDERMKQLMMDDFLLSWSLWVKECLRKIS